MRYQEDNELHRDFHGTTNLTIDYLLTHYGEDALKSVLRKTGHDVYKSIRERLATGSAAELIEHLNWFFYREGAEFNMNVKQDEIRFEVFDCPAIKHLKKLGVKISDKVCLQTSEVNAGMCEGTPWVSSVEHLGEGHCVQIFKKVK